MLDFLMEILPIKATDLTTPVLKYVGNSDAMMTLASEVTTHYH